MLSRRARRVHPSAHDGVARSALAVPRYLHTLIPTPAERMRSFSALTCSSWCGATISQHGTSEEIVFQSGGFARRLGRLCWRAGSAFRGHFAFIPIQPCFSTRFRVQPSSLQRMTHRQRRVVLPPLDTMRVVYAPCTPRVRPVYTCTRTDCGRDHRAVESSKEFKKLENRSASERNLRIALSLYLESPNLESLYALDSLRIALYSRSISRIALCSRSRLKKFI